MSEKNTLAHRLALLEEAGLPSAEHQAVMDEIADWDRIVAELEAFADGTPWISQQTQPSNEKV
ncbi:MAG TPA: hypothetical protein VJQ55_14955 [Candidatus Binatia bacterium]|nr:hypothetical protein [Candidatus Binatia bacterium]